MKWLGETIEEHKWIGERRKRLIAEIENANKRTWIWLADSSYFV